jgi:hypothetical protein
MVTVYSNKITVSVSGQQVTLSATLTPASSTITLGQSVTLTCSVSGGTAPYTYSWYVDGVNVGVYGSSYTYTPSTAGSHTVYVYVVDSQMRSTNSNTAYITVNKPSVTYNVSVSASPSTNISTNTNVTFTVSVTASDGSIPTGTVTLYINHASGQIWGTWPLTLTNGSATITLQPGLYLATGETYMTYYAIYQGYQSPTGQITFQTSKQPTYITLTASNTNPAPNTIVTFTLSTDGYNVAGTLYAYDSQSDAQNAPSLTGQLAQYAIAIGSDGTGSSGSLYPTQIAPTTYWIAVIGNVKSNIVQVVEQQVPITQISMCAKSTGYQGNVEFIVTTNAGGQGTVNLTGYSYNPSTGAVGGVIWGPMPYFSVVNGTANTTIVPGMVATNTAWQASINNIVSNYVYITNASSSSPGTINPTC